MRDQHYQAYSQHVQQLRDRFHDMRDLPNHPTTQYISREFEHLMADVKSGRNPREIEHRALGIQRQIMQAERQGQNIISPNHSNYFHQDIKRFSEQLRQHPHY